MTAAVHHHPVDDCADSLLAAAALSSSLSPIGSSQEEEQLVEGKLKHLKVQSAASQSPLEGEGPTVLVAQEGEVKDAPSSELLLLQEPLLPTTATDVSQQQQQQQQQSIFPSRRNHSRRNRYRYPSLLASSPRWVACLIPMLTLTSHLLFIYSQLAPFWRLSLDKHVDVWINTTSQESKWTADTLGLPHQNHIYVDEDKNVRTFTYGYALHELWGAKGLPGTFLPRLTAVLLILFSGVWPHLKLLLLNATFMVPFTSLQRRKRFLHWLAALGKWSLADVLAVCVLLAVLNLEWQVDPVAIKQGLVQQLPTMIPFIEEMYTPTELCTKLLKYDCAHAKIIKHVAKCKACTSLVYEAYTHPDWAQSTGRKLLRGVEMSGDGLVQLSVKGLHGIYTFCFAVTLSILLSLIVDLLDNRARSRQQQEQALIVQQRRVDDDDQQLLLESSDDEGVDSVEVDDCDIICWNSALQYIGLIVLSVITAAAVYTAILSPTMLRKADGALPQLLHDILGVAWEHPYSFESLMVTTGKSGGLDVLLLITFSIFIVLGPAVRALLCVLQAILLTARSCYCCCWNKKSNGDSNATAQLHPSSPRAKPSLLLAPWIDFVGAFCAWEVLFIAVIMVDIQIPGITNTILRKPQCKVISPDGSCFKVEFDILHAYGYVLIGGVLLLICASTLHAFTQRIARRQQQQPRLQEIEETPLPSLVGNNQEGQEEYQLLLRESEALV